jgi:hypothetical protein
MKSPRHRAIEAAIAAHNDADRETLLTPAVTRLLTVMFADADVCQRTIESLRQEGFSRKPLLRLLQQLVEAGFLTKEQQSHGRVANVYRLHLPPLVRR